MEHVSFDGIAVPRIGLGTWEVTGQSAYDSVRAAIDLGYRHIDTAQAYGNEAEVGRAIADSGVDRDDLFVTTKVWRTKAAAEDVLSSTEESLRTLGLEHVDLLLIHWPSDAAPVEETVAALDQARSKGWTRLIGVSNYTRAHVERALAVAPIATNQIEYHAFLGQDPMLTLLREHGMFLTAYSPLANGRAIGDETLDAIGSAHGVSGAQVALRWLVRQPDVVALPRSQDRDHIAANLDVLGFELDDDEVARIDELPKDQRQIDPGFAPDWD